MLYCVFCKKNGEVAEFYTSHKLKDENNEIICPVLKQYTCPTCKVTGQHTASYCPQKVKKPTAIKKKQQSSTKRVVVKEPAASPLKPPPLVSSTPAPSPEVVTVASPLQQAVYKRSENAQLKFPSDSKSLSWKQKHLVLPPFCKPGGVLTRGMMSVMLREALDLRPSERLVFFIRHDYNPERFPLVKQAAYIAEYLIISNCVS